jgi:uncharacterized protein (TIGR02466 family)
MPETRLHNLFPTPVWVVDFEQNIHEPLNAQIIRHLDAMIEERPAVDIGATLQTDNNMHEFDEFADLVAQLRRGTAAVLEFLEIKYDTFEITGCWANINPTGGINTPHTHPNNYLSGVYYVQTQQGADSIFFSDPRPQAGVVLPPTNSETIYSGNEIGFDAKAGRLIMFPSWLVHGVPANRSNRDRISVSFNVMFSGYTDSMSKPSWSPSVTLKRQSNSVSG